MEKMIDIRDKVLLFDFDGTLVVTEILAKTVVDVYLKEQKLGDIRGFSDLIIGRTWKSAVEAMQGLAQSRGMNLDSSEVLIREFKNRYREKFLEGVSLVPGLREVLPELQAKAKYMGIVTGSERHEVESILSAHQLGLHFEKIWGFGDYEFSKPHPSPYLTAMEELKAGPDQVIVFEDSKAGMESAHQAGLRWVQVAHESHALEHDPRSLVVIRDWSELKI